MIYTSREWASQDVNDPRDSRQLAKVASALYNNTDIDHEQIDEPQEGVAEPTCRISFADSGGGWAD